MIYQYNLNWEHYESKQTAIFSGKEIIISQTGKIQIPISAHIAVF